MMTKKIYKEFAAILNKVGGNHLGSFYDNNTTVDDVFDDIFILTSKMFKADNPNFDESKFRDACYGPDTGNEDR